MLADRMERRALNERTVAAVFIAAGGEGELPDPDEALAAFDAALTAEPAQVDPERELLLRGLGLR